MARRKADSATGCSRRQAMALMAAGSCAAFAAGPAFAFAAPQTQSGRARAPTTTYFNDGLLADPGGASPAWRRPRGYRGAGRIARLSEAERIAAGFMV